MNALFGLTGVIWSLSIASHCALATMLIVYLLRDRLTQLIHLINRRLNISSTSG